MRVCKWLASMEGLLVIGIVTLLVAVIVGITVPSSLQVEAADWIEKRESIMSVEPRTVRMVVLDPQPKLLAGDPGDPDELIWPPDWDIHDRFSWTDGEGGDPNRIKLLHRLCPDKCMTGFNATFNPMLRTAAAKRRENCSWRMLRVGDTWAWVEGII